MILGETESWVNMNYELIWIMGEYELWVSMYMGEYELWVNFGVDLPQTWSSKKKSRREGRALF